MNEEYYHKILGTNKQDSWEDIKKSFFKIAMKTHPDRGGSEKDFKEANSAYEFFKNKYKNNADKDDTKNDYNISEDSVIFEKVIGSLGLILGRANFFKLISYIIGFCGILFALFVIFISQEENTFDLLVLLFLVSFFMFFLGYFIESQKSKILKNINNFPFVTKCLFKLSVILIIFGAISTLLLLGTLPALGLFSLFYFISIIFNTVKALYFIKKYQKPKTEKSRSNFDLIRFIYPKINHEVSWHRLVTVIGWLVSILSVWFIFIVFPIYFIIVQRLIYFVVYGDKKEKWNLSA
jgi:hypothetical protein